MSDRDNLTARQIPFMELSDGSAASLTAPPAPLPHYLNHEGRAIARFAVEGNVVGKSLLLLQDYFNTRQDWCFACAISSRANFLPLWIASTGRTIRK